MCERIPGEDEDSKNTTAKKLSQDTNTLSFRGDPPLLPPNNENSDDAVQEDSISSLLDYVPLDARGFANIKIGIFGDSGIGKTSILNRLLENKFDSDYIETQGVNFYESRKVIKNQNVTFSIWDISGSKSSEALSSINLIAGDIDVALLAFDLTKISTLYSFRDWYRYVSTSSHVILVGSKYDLYNQNPNKQEKKDIKNLAIFLAKKMNVSLIFVSSASSINIKKIFLLAIAKRFGIRTTIVNDPLVIL